MVSDNQLVVLAGVALQTMEPATLQLATAIALAESGGNETKTNTNDNGSIDVGLWQINSVHRRTHPGWTPAWLKIPENNAQAMAVVSGGGSNWQPWFAYTNGKYEQFMDRAGEAVAATPTASGADVAVGAAADAILPEPLEALAEAAAKFTSIVSDAATWVGDPSNWIRIVQVVGGVLLGIAAINIVVKPVVTDVAGDAVTIATKAIAKGK